MEADLARFPVADALGGDEVKSIAVCELEPGVACEREAPTLRGVCIAVFGAVLIPISLIIVSIRAFWKLHKQRPDLGS